MKEGNESLKREYNYVTYLTMINHHRVNYHCKPHNSENYLPVDYFV